MGASGMVACGRARAQKVQTLPVATLLRLQPPCREASVPTRSVGRHFVRVKRRPRAGRHAQGGHSHGGLPHARAKNEDSALLALSASLTQSSMPPPPCRRPPCPYSALGFGFSGIGVPKMPGPIVGLMPCASWLRAPRRMPSIA